MVRQRFPKERLEKRIKDFRSYMEQHKDILCYELKRERNNKRPFIISNGSQLAKVSFTPMGGIHLIARDGTLRTFILGWLTQEGLSFTDYTNDEWVEELDHSFREIRSSILPSPVDVRPTANAIRMIPRDHPLVELAERLDYKVFLVPPSESSLEQISSLRYYIVSNYDREVAGQDLAETLASFIKRQLK